MQGRGLGLAVGTGLDDAADGFEDLLENQDRQRAHRHALPVILGQPNQTEDFGERWHLQSAKVRIVAGVSISVQSL